MSQPSRRETDPRREPAPAPSLPELFLVFARIGLTSFGGGLSGWLMREFVTRRRWLSEEEFLNGLAISQAFPGVNVANMAIWIGFRLLGTPGAFAGLLGIVVPAAVLIIALAVGFASLRDYPLTHVVLAGAAAAAIGLSLSMALRTAIRVPRRAAPLGIATVTFAAVGILHWPLVPVVGGMGALSVALAFLHPRTP